MPGYWEIKAQRPNVLCAILTRETVTTKWAASFRRLQLPPNSSETFISGMPFGHARNTAVESVLKHGFEWLFFLDDDVCAPPDTVPRLLAHNRDVISGVYYRRAPVGPNKSMPPVMLKYKNKDEAEWVTQWDPPGSLIEVDLVGAGCLLVNRRIFERLPRPWFTWELEPDITKWIRQGMGTEQDQPIHSEDFSFCRRVRRELNLPIAVDTSIQCEHIGLGSSGAHGYAPASL